jgi:hypothetical protein
MHRVNFRLASKVMVPAAIPFEELRALGLDERRYRPYPGIKEQVALADFEPDDGTRDAVLDELRLDAGRPIAVLRPPATMSLYHRGLRSTLFDDALAYLLASGVQVVVLPRTPVQAVALRATPGVVLPESPVDGPALIWAADLVVSAGGTMNREAAVMGVPTWTTFAGTLGAVDRMLVDQGRLRVLSRPEQLPVTSRVRAWTPPVAIADSVTEEILRTSP